MTDTVPVEPPHPNPPAKPTESPPSHHYRLALELAAGLGGLILTVLLFVFLQARERQLMETQFQLDAKERAEAIRLAVINRLGIVGTISAFFTGSETVERSEFHTFVEPLLTQAKGIRGLAWAPRISETRRSRHEQAVRDEGFDDYRINERDANRRFTVAGERHEYFPLLYVAPFRGNETVLGFDVGSRDVYRSVMQRAASTGKAAATVCPPLRPDDPPGNLLLVFVPIGQDQSHPIDGWSEPSNSGEGYVIGAFRIGEILNQAMSIFQPLGIDFYIYDSTEESKNTLIAVRLSSAHGPGAELAPAPAETTPPKAAVHYPVTIEVADRRWTIDCVPMNDYFLRKQRWGPHAVFVAGLVVTGILTGFVHVLNGRAARVEQLVAERTQKLRESEQRFRCLVDNAGDAFFLRDMQGKIHDVNRWACESLGYTREELLRMSIPDIDIEFIPKDLGRFSKLPPEAYPVCFEGVEQRKDGTTFPVEVRSTAVDVGGQRMMVSLARDITERKRAEGALRDQQQLLRELLDLHERDRKLTAYEIHDGLAQQLTGALYKLQAFERMRDREPENATAMFDDAVALLRESMAEVRRLIGGLRPPILDESGVAVAVEALIAERQSRDGPKIEFTCDPNFPRLAPPVESAAFRIIQEGLTNACRYSQSETIHVTLSQAGQYIRIEVRDWGVGFVLDQVVGDHFGLRGIRERAKLLGGFAAIETAPNQGTRIVAELPLIPPAV